jgi:hypothetical protein
MRPVKTAVITTSLLALEESALACGTCTLDGGGQTLMLIAMLTLPLVVAAIGYGAIRRLLAKLDAS